MDSSVVNDLEGPIDIQFVTEFDSIPGFWNYLAGLNRDDLIAELIQNDLDQGATRTVILFERTCLVCDGNGRPVEPDGWRRLRKIQGAGDEVPTKDSKIGVKNHGLKTAFTIGDEFRLMSAGRAIVQTLFANGRSKRPHPGASPQPMDDPEAPAVGCRVVIRYRGNDLEVRQGEAIKLNKVSTEEIDTLFRSACGSLPEQFAGIVSPEITPRYEIVLRHWSLGEVQFLFSCTRPRQISKRIEIFQRRCTINGTLSPLPEALREQAVRRLVPLKGVLKDRAADFFRRGRHLFVEASWPIERNGRPKTGAGQFRYPIGYPPNSHEAYTGHSTHFSAPFASDKERHAPAQNEATNGELREACESLLIDTLAHNIIPRWQAAGLNPVVPNSDADDGLEVVRSLLTELAKKGAFPVLNWRKAAKLALKGKKVSVKAVERRLAARRASKETKRYPFVVPATTWAEDAIHPALCLLCPSSEMQLDPRTHPRIIRLLTDYNTPGFAEKFFTFDENDVFDRVTGDGNQYFGTVADPEREFSRLFIARAYLDLIKLALDREVIDERKEDMLIASLSLPNVHSQVTSLSELHSSASLPSDIPGLNLPPFLHAAVAAHPLFRKRKWRRPKYTMDRFLEGGVLQAASEQTRRQFWYWLRRNQRYIAPRGRTKLADLAIWPDENGHLCRIPDLCVLRSRRVAAVLGDSVRQAHDQVRSSRLASVGGKARTSIRRVPTEQEIAGWLGTRMAAFEMGRTPNAATIGELSRFEAELAILIEDAAIARQLKATEVKLPALAQDGSMQPRTTLVMPSQSNIRLALPGRFMLKNPRRAAALDKLSPALSEPTAAMLLDALAEDPSNFSALHPRLKRFFSVTVSGDDERLRLAEMPILPVHGQPRTPSELAFKGNRGDYWGAWKTQILGKGLSQDEQGRYRAVGVTSALPSAVTSRAFFVWLSDQDQAVVEHHIPCVLRHILHPLGPTNWAESYTDTPFIPAKGRDGLRLVSARTARSRPVYLSDAGEIGDTVIRMDRAVFLAIDHVREVTEPISEPLRMLGVRSLREALKEPKSVTGTGNIVPVGEDILARFRELKSFRFRRTFLKRLNELGVESELVRHDWQDRLDRVREIRFTEEVEARYRFRTKSYALEVDAGFDPDSGIFWMRSDQGIGPRTMYESLAKQMVFKPAARPIHLLALERVVGLEIYDPSFGRPTGSGSGASDDDIGTDEGERDERDDMGADPGEATAGHSPFEPNPARNRPNPSPIPTGSAGRARSSTGQRGSSGSGDDRGGSRQTPQLEREHRDALKLQHYASHCQMCLCERTPQELAPAGSYIEWEEVRRQVVEAHHPDLVSAGGARHAGNLILLCKLHHDNYGRQLSRTAITNSIRDSSKEKSISFNEDSQIRGRQIEFKISGTGDIVSLFFTDHHIEYWLSQEE